MSCLVCEKVLEDETRNYCGCERCGACGYDFCDFSCIQNCIICGIETFETNYCGCEDCYICNKPFCSLECIEENIEPIEEFPEDDSEEENS